MKGKTGKKESSKVYEYDAQGSPEAKEGMDETPEFKKGGATKKKAMHGGHAKGKAPAHRLDRKPRASGGRSPYSSASSTSSEGDYKDDNAKGEVDGPGAETELEIYKHGGHVKKHKSKK